MKLQTYLLKHAETLGVIIPGPDDIGIEWVVGAESPYRISLPVFRINGDTGRAFLSSALATEPVMRSASTRSWHLPGAPCLPYQRLAETTVRRIVAINGTAGEESARVELFGRHTYDPPTYSREELDPAQQPLVEFIAERARVWVERALTDAANRLFQAEYTADLQAGERRLVRSYERKHWWVGIFARCAPEVVDAYLRGQACDRADRRLNDMLYQQAEAIRRGGLHWIASLIIEARYYPVSSPDPIRDEWGAPVNAERVYDRECTHVSWIPGTPLPRSAPRSALREIRGEASRSGRDRDRPTIGSMPAALPREHYTVVADYREFEGTSVPETPIGATKEAPKVPAAQRSRRSIRLSAL